MVAPILVAIHASDLQAAETSGLTWSVVRWNSHLQSVTTIAKVLSRKDGTLLADQERSLWQVSNISSALVSGTHREGVAADIIGAD